MSDKDDADFTQKKDETVKEKTGKASKKNYTVINNKFLSPDLIDTPIYDDELMSDLLAEIACNMFNEMNEQGLTISELAKKSGVDYSYLCRLLLEHNTKLGMSVFIRLSIALKTAPSKFFPCDAAVCKTNGQRFDELTKGIDIAGKNFLLGLCADYCKEHERLEKLNDIDVKEVEKNGLDC